MRGTASKVSPSAGFRLVCYCTDCQAFARFLERPDVLDAAGGTDIFQMPAGRVTFSAGADAVRCISFSGRVLRWYTECCRTPIANTAAGRRFPIVALIHSFMDQAFLEDLAGGRSRDAVLGRPVCRILRTLRPRAIAANGASGAIALDLRPARSKVPRLVVARARPAEPVLRRCVGRSPFRASRAHAQRAWRALRPIPGNGHERSLHR